MKNKKVQQNVNRKRFKRREKSKTKAKRTRFVRNDEFRYSHFEGVPYGRKLKAPTNFSLKHNRGNVIRFITKLEDRLGENKSVFVVLKHVKLIDLEAIVLLLGIIAEFKTKKIDFNGDFPKNIPARKKLKNSGFLQQLNVQFNNEQFIDSKGIFTHGKDVVDQVWSAEIIAKALVYVFEEKRRSQGAQRILLEAMKNTLHHAGINSSEKRHWWLSLSTNKAKKKVTFSFLDYGVGIFKSLSTKGEEEPGYSKEKLFELGPENHKVLENIMTGKRHVSRTRQKKHGIGLPSMRTALVNNYVSSLVIMSNDVYADIGNNRYELLNCSFSGTFIQFEVTQDCKSFNYLPPIQ